MIYFFRHAIGYGLLFLILFLLIIWNLYIWKIFWEKKILFLEKSANTNTFSLLSANTNSSSGIGAFLEPIPPIP
jgi:hypothetical protein